MDTTPVASDTPLVSTMSESLASPPSEAPTHSMEVDAGDDDQPPVSPVFSREDDLLTGGNVMVVEGEMANLKVSSPGGQDGSDGDTCT